MPPETAISKIRRNMKGFSGLSIGEGAAIITAAPTYVLGQVLARKHDRQARRPHDQAVRKIRGQKNNCCRGCGVFCRHHQPQTNRGSTAASVHGTGWSSQTAAAVIDSRTICSQVRMAFRAKGRSVSCTDCFCMDGSYRVFRRRSLLLPGEIGKKLLDIVREFV